MFVDVENLLLHFDLNVGDEFTFALTRILFGEGEEPPLKPREASNQATAISNVWEGEFSEGCFFKDLAGRGLAS